MGGRAIDDRNERRFPGPVRGGRVKARGRSVLSHGARGCCLRGVRANATCLPRDTVGRIERAKVQPGASTADLPSSGRSRNVGVPAGSSSSSREGFEEGTPRTFRERTPTRVGRSSGSDRSVAAVRSSRDARSDPRAIPLFRAQRGAREPVTGADACQTSSFLARSNCRESRRLHGVEPIAHLPPAAGISSEDITGLEKQDQFNPGPSRNRPDGSRGRTRTPTAATGPS